ncbi:unnamed protein product [Brassica oleracea]
MIPLVFLIFYEVSGGLFGAEGIVNVAGPLLALLGFIIFPFIWCIPEALITAEMSTMFPINGGFVVWVSSSLKFVIFVTLSNFLPLLSGTGAIPLNRELWTDGFLAEVAGTIGGGWLRVWVQVAAATSNMGMFIAEMSSDSFQLLGMAELGMLPEVFAKRSRYGTPLLGIVCSASGVLLLSGLSFQDIVAAENMPYCGGMVLEFVAFVRMRVKHPAASRPYKIPAGTVGSVLICVPPIVLICLVVVLLTLKVAVVSFVMVMVGLLMKPCLDHMDRKRWVQFSVSCDLPEFQKESQEMEESLLR